MICTVVYLKWKDKSYYTLFFIRTSNFGTEAERPSYLFFFWQLEPL